MTKFNQHTGKGLTLLIMLATSRMDPSLVYHFPTQDKQSSNPDDHIYIYTFTVLCIISSRCYAHIKKEEHRNELNDTNIMSK